jgi:hypothetical protein
MPKSRARAGGRPACAVGGDHPGGPTMGTIWRAARGGDLCPIRTSAPRLPGPARSHQFAPSSRRGTAFSRVTSPQGRARSPAPTALPAPRSPSDGQVHRDNTQRRDSALGGHPPSAVCDEPNVLVDPIRHVLVDPIRRSCGLTSRSGAGRPRRCQSSPARCEQCSVAEAGRGAGEEIRASDRFLSAERPKYAPGVIVYQRVQVVGSVALFAFRSAASVWRWARQPLRRAAAQILDVNVQRVGCPLQSGER